MVKAETEAPALWRKPPETANPSTLDKRASPRLYRFWEAAVQHTGPRDARPWTKQVPAGSRRATAQRPRRRGGSGRVGVGRPRPARLPAGRVALPSAPPEVFLRHELAPMKGGRQQRMGRPLPEPSHGDDQAPAQPIPSTVAPGGAVRPLRPPYHLAYAAATASQMSSEPDISALLQHLGVWGTHRCNRDPTRCIICSGVSLD